MINLCRKILLRLKTEDGWTHAKAAMCGKKKRSSVSDSQCFLFQRALLVRRFPAGFENGSDRAQEPDEASRLPR